MAILSLSNARLAFGHVALLDNAAFSLQTGERLGLIGRNGAGKSSLLKIVAGLERLDDGLLQLTQGLRIRYVAQEPVFESDVTVFHVVSKGVAEAKAVRAAYEAHAAQDAAHGAAHDATFDALHERIEALDAWNWEQRVATTLAHLQLDGDRRIDELSGGTKKRVALAQALVAVPDVLLLDEPTNHLDLDSIVWLEALLQDFRGAVMLVSHDRDFLDNVVTRIVELDRAVLRSYPGNFSTYERVKEEQLAAEALAGARADKLLAQEEVWVRKGVEARRTRSVARVQRLQALRAQRIARRESLGQVRLEVDSGIPSGKIVAELRDVSMGFDAKLLVKQFSATVLRGDKVGLIGPNGCGKTTLLKLILGECAPKSGSVRLGTRLEVAYFDQLRSRLDLNATLADTISPGSEWVEINGGRRHVMSYLSDFLFSPERANSPVRTLSGGERNRVLLARLFALPANVLVLDEPTNDLDIDTLELLEELLQAYTGTVFLVSHDRRFLDNVVTSTIAWAGDEAPGLWREYEGGYRDWEQQRSRGLALRESQARSVAGAVSASTPVAARSGSNLPRASKPRKLSFKEQRELDEFPQRIERLESEQKELGTLLADPNVYRDDVGRAMAAQSRYAQIEAELLVALERWEALDQRR
ncbi:MAG: ATP-binding cassette domain-containing protein [Burkholderiales bacterium]|jgi:ATP-binding cassette subfamily F protein uup|nr:ATP-binding cassette domain-containing protein [Burkholderiales bacterium]